MAIELQPKHTFSAELLTFGIIRDIVGGAKLNLEIPVGCTVAELQDILKDRFPTIRTLRSFLIAVNNEYGDMALVLQVGDEIALIPPVSGG
ncbi:MAG: MoaD/ThiS family protein [Bacteroidota bacterium]